MRRKTHIPPYVRRGLLALGASLSALVVVELSCYGYLRLIPSRFNHFRYYLEGMIMNFHPLFRPEGGQAAHRYYPYVGYYKEGKWDATPPPAPAYPDGWVLPLQVGSDGRQNYATMEKTPGTVRVIALGGSTMAGFGQSAPDKHITARLEERLERAFPGRKVEVLNGSFYTYIAAEEMVVLATKLLLYKPDAIVVVDGYNELISAYYYPELAPLWGQHQAFLVRNMDRLRSIPGVFSQAAFLLSKRFYSLAMARVVFYVRRTHSAGAASAGGSPVPLDTARYDRALEEYLFVQKSLIGLARAHDIPLVLALQPILTLDKPLSPEEKTILSDWEANKPRYNEAAGYFFPRLRRKYRSFIALNAGRGGVTARDLTGLFSSRKETLYIDSCHYNDRAADLIAAALAEPVAQALRQ